MPEHSPPPALRVLIVEDDKLTADNLRKLVCGWGHDARMTHDGPAALEVARWFQPHAVLLDIVLRGMDGWQVAAALLELPVTRASFLLAVTGYGKCDDLEPSLEVGLPGH